MPVISSALSIYSCHFFALIVFSPLFLVIAIVVYAKHGSPVFFKQARPGRKTKDGHEKLFTLYKFQTMTDARNEDGTLLPDGLRLTPVGAWLRSSSLDEMPVITSEKKPRRRYLKKVFASLVTQSDG